jgi:hypothetical protein
VVEALITAFCLLGLVTLLLGCVFAGEQSNWHLGRLIAHIELEAGLEPLRPLGHRLIRKRVGPVVVAFSSAFDFLVFKPLVGGYFMWLCLLDWLYCQTYRRRRFLVAAAFGAIRGYERLGGLNSWQTQRALSALNNVYDLWELD